MSTPPAILTASAVSYSYGSTPALAEASLAVGDGELVAVTGASGSGKSTLLHCLAGILRPSSGAVTLAGRRIDVLSEAERSVLRRTTAGVVFQFGQLVPELTLGENVALPLMLGGQRRKQALVAAGDWLGQFGVADLADRRPGQVSGGQQQRAAIARALITEPAVLFADEPTGALDALSSEQVLTELVRVARERGTALVLVTHDAQVAAYADREIVVRDGRIDSAAVTL